MWMESPCEPVPFTVARALRLLIAIPALCAAGQPWEIPVMNETQSFQPVGSAECGAVNCLLLKNMSGKDIMSVTYSAPPKTYTVEVDFLHSDTEEPVATGAVYKLRAPEASNPQQVIKIVAIVFADGSSEGDPQQAAVTRARWLGWEVQQKRIAPLLDRLLAQLDGGISDEALGEAAEVLQSLPESPDTAAGDLRQPDIARLLTDSSQVTAFQSGLRNAKWTALTQLEKLKTAARAVGPDYAAQVERQFLQKMKAQNDLELQRAKAARLQ